MSLGELGVIDAIAFGLGLLAEIPSGVVADKLGKKKTIIVAFLLCALGAFGVALASTKFAILIFFMLVNSGWSLYSGAAEALAYDSLADHHKSADFDSVISYAHILGIVSLAFTSLAGGPLYEWQFRLPHIAWGVFYLLGFFLAFFLTEPKSEKFESLEIDNSFTTHFIDGIKHIFSGKLIYFIPLLFVAGSIFFIYDYGFLLPVMMLKFGFESFDQSILFAVMSLIAVVCIYTVPYLRRIISDYSLLMICTFILGTSFLLSGVITGFSGVFLLIVIAVVGNMLVPISSIILNERIPPAKRATSLSAFAFVVKLPYVIFAIFAGAMVEAGNLNNVLFAIGTICYLLVLIYSIITYYRQKWTV